MKKTLFLNLWLTFFTSAICAQVVNYPAPKGSALNNERYKVSIRQKGGSWLPVPVYMAQVAQTTDTKISPQISSFAYFDFQGEFDVLVQVLKEQVSEAKLRPNQENLPIKVTGNSILLKLSKPKNFSLEVNGDIFNNLHLFANPLEQQPTQGANLVYYGPGLHTIGDVVLKSGQRVYIAGGAVVQGRFIVSNAEDVRIYGHGILTQLFKPNAPPGAGNGSATRQYANGRADAITVEYSKDVKVEGIIVLPHKYTVLMGQSSDINVDNIKSFSFEGNGDGLDIFCCTNVNISRVFMRNSDDCIAIYGHRWKYYGNSTNITVKNAVLWADVAHPLLIGTHGDSADPDTLSKMKFANLDILDQHENQLDYQGCLALNAGDDNLIKDIVFDSIRVDNIRKGQLINLRVMFNKKYNTSPGRGIEDVLFRNIVYKGDKASPSIITGYDELHKIKNITFENLTINGRTLFDSMPQKPSYYKTSDLGGIFIGEHVENYKFIKSEGGAPKVVTSGY
ncbi:glycosyl hydrolase family 28 protein [Mucilaginibacter sp. PAMB04274]|uniref:glycosyl hydrolase family 28 protein n=1 Tax=Mucilaginibacter sp. PAMB04274 TaxID=3138568 RepID=UPI0031F62556